MVVTLGQDTTGEKLTVMLYQYTYFHRHARPPDKNKTKSFLVRTGRALIN